MCFDENMAAILFFQAQTPIIWTLKAFNFQDNYRIFFVKTTFFFYIILRVSLITFSRPRHSRTVPPTDDLRADIEVTMIHLFNLLSYLSMEFNDAEPSLPPKAYRKLSISTTSCVDLKKKESSLFLKKSFQKLSSIYHLKRVKKNYENPKSFFRYHLSSFNASIIAHHSGI